MNKKKLVSLCLVLALVLTAVIGGTMAYFTDTDEATNVFTTGDVQINLEETFDESTAQLIPGKDINKDVKIQNVGTNDAYVWYTYAIPAVLDSTDNSTGTNNILHVNALGRTWDDYAANSKYWAEGQTSAYPLERTWDHDPNEELTDLVGPEGFIGTMEDENGIEYNVYLVLYHGVVTPGTETTQAMDKVYLDTKVDYVEAEGNEEAYYTINGKAIDFDFSEVKIIVNAYGIQAEGFADVYAAYKAFPVEL